MDDAILARFEKYVMPEPNTGCWLWIGGVRGDPIGGQYGVLRVNARKKESAHRLPYQHWKGTISEGLVVDHRCRVRRCVNPDHLRLLTFHQNVIQNSKSFQAKNAAKTECLRGHPFTLENTNVYDGPDGRRRRVCRRCNYERGSAWALAKRRRRE